MFLRETALKLLVKSPNASLVIAGDFNEDLDGPSITQGLGVSADRSKALGTSGDSTVFYNLLGDIPADKRGSYYYARRKVWNTFDAIIVPQTMLLPAKVPGPAWRVQVPTSGVTKTFALPEMREEGDGRPKSYRRVRIKNKPENYYIEGYSDHFPIITVLQRGKIIDATGAR